MLDFWVEFQVTMNCKHRDWYFSVQIKLHWWIVGTGVQQSNHITVWVLYPPKNQISCWISVASQQQKTMKIYHQDVASFREHGGWVQMKLQVRGIIILTNGNLIIISTTERRLNSRIQRYRCLPKMCIIFVNQANKPSKKNRHQAMNGFNWMSFRWKRRLPLK
jgi:hypothetical protein